MADAAQNPTIGGLKASDFYMEVANTGLKIFGGYLVEDFDPNLQGLRGARVLREMQDTDPVVGAILFAITESIRKVKWHLQPADQSPAGLMAQEFYESCMIDMQNSWDDFISDIVSMLTFGYAPFEIVLKERNGKQPLQAKSSRFDDGMIGLRKLAIRGQETILRWIMDADNNEILGMVQIPWNGGIRTIPAEKLLLFRTIATKNNPQGRSLLRNAYRPYYFKKRIEEIEAIGVERDLAGLPVARVPAELIAAAASGNDPKAAATYASYKALVTNIRRNTQEGVVLPSNTDEHGKPVVDLQLLHSGGTRQFDTTKIITRYTEQIAGTVMADFLLMGTSSRGSGGAALGPSKVDMFFQAIEAVVQSIAVTLNTRLVPLLGEINGIPEKFWPEFYADKAEQVDLGRLGAYINALAASGMQMFPDPDLEAYLRGIAGLPVANEEIQQQNDQANQVERAATMHQQIQSMQPPEPQAPANGKTPSNAGGGGGNPAKPQGQYGGPRAAPSGGVRLLKPQGNSASEPAV